MRLKGNCRAVVYALTAIAIAAAFSPRGIAAQTTIDVFKNAGIQFGGVQPGHLAGRRQQCLCRRRLAEKPEHQPLDDPALGKCLRSHGNLSKDDPDRITPSPRE